MGSTCSRLVEFLQGIREIRGQGAGDSSSSKAEGRLSWKGEVWRFRVWRRRSLEVEARRRRSLEFRVVAEGAARGEGSVWRLEARWAAKEGAAIVKQVRLRRIRSDQV